MELFSNEIWRDMNFFWNFVSCATAQTIFQTESELISRNKSWNITKFVTELQAGSYHRIMNLKQLFD
jgi:hypothetical protein